MTLHTRALVTAVLTVVAVVLVVAGGRHGEVTPAPGYDDCNAHPDITVCATVDVP